MNAGIYDITRAEYDQIDAVSASLILAGPTMAHRKAWIDGKRETTDAMRFGTALHCFLLEPDRFASDYHVCTVPPDRKSNWGKAYWAGVLQDLQGDEKEMEKRRKAASADWDRIAGEKSPERIVDEPEYETFVAMRAALHQSARRRALAQTPGRYEVVIVWKDEDTGLLCKGMLDKLIEKIDTVVDLKRAISADSGKFGKACADHGYDVRAAWYLDGLKVITGREHSYVLLPQEPDFPHLSAMYPIEFGDTNYEAGRMKYRDVLPALAHCMKSGEFPGYGDEPLPLVMPKWAYPMDHSIR